MPQLTHSLLLQFAPASQALARAAAQAATRLAGQRIAGIALARVAHQLPAGCYAYLALPAPAGVGAAAVQALQAALRASGDAALAACRLSRLQSKMQRAGASAGAPASMHYVVETDPEDGWHEELYRWYDEEHMPGLAAVAGTVRAERYLNLDHGPLSFACYDLVNADVMGSPDWLAVRATCWSSRVRPHFTNTKRTMFQRMG